MCQASEHAGSALPRYFFIHVMKTGGTALTTNVSKNFRVDEVYPHPDLDLSGLQRGQHPLASGHDRLSPLVARGTPRHHPSLRSALPVRRMRVARRRLLHDDDASRSGRPHDLAPPPTPANETSPTANDRAEETTLEEIYERRHVFESLVHNHQTKIFSMTVADHPKGYMQTIDVDAARLADAKRNLESVDVVGLTEHHADFVDELAERFGWRLKREVRGERGA